MCVYIQPDVAMYGDGEEEESGDEGEQGRTCCTIPYGSLFCTCCGILQSTKIINDDYCNLTPWKLRIKPVISSPQN